MKQDKDNPDPLYVISTCVGGACFGAALAGIIGAFIGVIIGVIISVIWFKYEE